MENENKNKNTTRFKTFFAARNHFMLEYDLQLGPSTEMAQPFIMDPEIFIKKEAV